MTSESIRSSRCTVAIGAGAAALFGYYFLRRQKRGGELSPWDCKFDSLSLADLPADGRELLMKWLNDAEKKAGVSARVMAVATSTLDEGATVRSVLFHMMEDNGDIIFGTNAQSQKTRALDIDPRCELLFRWGDRQVRVRGKARKALASPESDAAFLRLPRHCQLGLQCLKQGTMISEVDHTESKKAYKEQVSIFGLEKNHSKLPPRPTNYTAVVVTPDYFEFYQGGQPGYINDRFLFCRDLATGNFLFEGRLQA